VRADHAGHGGANLVHRALADPGVEQRLRRVGSVFLVQRDRRLELDELLAEELVQSPEAVALFDGPMADENFAQAMECLADLRKRRVIGLQVLFLSREQVSALACFGIDDEPQRLMQRGFHLERDGHLPVGDLETAKPELRVHGDRERCDDPEHQRDDDLEGQSRFQRAEANAHE
jgi:hypothetical protein